MTGWLFSVAVVIYYETREYLRITRADEDAALQPIMAKYGFTREEAIEYLSSL